MRSVFIISEYNPFHTGHAFQISRIRSELAPDAVISLMSGHFVQRGEPAILDKFTRADLALAGGSDLVIELPVIWATSSAEFFARGGVALAGALDPRGTLSFGSESGELTKIVTVARLLGEQKNTLDRTLRPYLDQGMTFPQARARAFAEMTGDPGLAAILASPNDILGVEYVKAIHALAHGLTPHTIKRQGMGYHDTDLASTPQQFPSASALRRSLAQGDLAQALSGMPEACQRLFQTAQVRSLLGDDALRRLIHYRLALFPEAIGVLPEAGDGLGQRIVQAREELTRLSLHDFALAVKTRRHTYTRIRRLLLHLALGFDALDYDRRRRQTPTCARVLALNETGQAWLAATRKVRRIPVVQSHRQIPEDDRRPDQNAARLYSLLAPQLAADADFTHALRVARTDQPDQTSRQSTGPLNEPEAGKMNPEP